MYTSGSSIQFRGPIPTNKSIPSAPPDGQPPPAPKPSSGSQIQHTRLKKKNLRNSMISFNSVLKKKPTTSVRSSSNQKKK